MLAWCFRRVPDSGPVSSPHRIRLIKALRSAAAVTLSCGGIPSLVVGWLPKVPERPTNEKFLGFVACEGFVRTQVSQIRLLPQSGFCHLTTGGKLTMSGVAGIPFGGWRRCLPTPANVSSCSSPRRRWIRLLLQLCAE